MTKRFTLTFNGYYWLHPDIKERKETHWTSDREDTLGIVSKETVVKPGARSDNVLTEKEIAIISGAPLGTLE